jgi:TrmH family RNA methyltransferase
MKTITSTSHDLVQHWVRLQKDRDYRRSSQRVLVEGKNLLKDLLIRHKPLRLMVTEKHKDLFPEFNLETAVGPRQKVQDFESKSLTIGVEHSQKVKATPSVSDYASKDCVFYPDPTAVSRFNEERIIISEIVASKIAAVKESEGCFAEYVFPPQGIPAHIENALILDGLQDPGNVGTLLRTALALNVQTIFIIEPACDPWNPKTIRAAKGAQFDLSIISCTWDKIPPQAPLLVADIEGENMREFLPPKNWFLVLGNEAHGHTVPQSLHPHFIKIPMPGPVESLNVSQAGAILLYMLTN